MVTCIFLHVGKGNCERTLVQENTKWISLGAVSEIEGHNPA